MNRNLPWQRGPRPTSREWFILYALLVPLCTLPLFLFISTADPELPEFGFAKPPTTAIPAVTTTAGSSIKASRSRYQVPEVEQGYYERPITTSGEGLLVQIKKTDNEQPVADAKIHFLDTGHCDLSDFLTIHHRDPRRFMTEIKNRGLHFLTDKDGRVRIPYPEDHALVVAEKNNFMGIHEIRADDQDGNCLRIAPAKTLAVKVVDKTGNILPLSAVVLRVKKGDLPTDLLVATTGQANGIALFPHANFFFREKGPKKRGIRTTIGSLFTPRVARDFDPQHLPDQPMCLVIPARGSVMVRFLNEPGDQVKGHRYVTIESLKKGEESCTCPGCHENRLHAIPLTKDRLRIPSVGLGLHFQICAFRGWGEGKISATGPGPTKPGEEVTFTLDNDDAYLQVTGRISTEKGTLLVNQPIDIKHIVFIADGTTREQETQQLTLVTNQDGRFIFSIDPDWLDHRQTILVTTSIRGVTVNTSRDFSYRRHKGKAKDLGDLRLRPAPFLVGGRITDPQGLPIGRVRIFANFRDFSYQTYSNNKGRFEIHGIAPPKLLGELEEILNDLDEECDEPVELPIFQMNDLSFSKPGFCDFTQDNLPLNEKDLNITLRPAGALAGRVLWDKVVFPDGLDVYVRVDGKGRRLGREKESFSFSSVPTGLAWISIIAGSEYLPFTYLNDLVINQGKTTRDPRLNPLDLRGLFRRFSLTITDHRGKPIKSGGVSWGENYRCSTSFRNGKWQGILPIERQKYPFKITAKRYHPVIIKGAFHATRICMDLKKDETAHMEGRAQAR